MIRSIVELYFKAVRPVMTLWWSSNRTHAAYWLCCNALLKYAFSENRNEKEGYGFLTCNKKQLI